jgi:ABC-type polar amino acid transport system ATPase subunit
MEGGDTVTDVLSIAGLRLSRASRPVLDGLDLVVSAGELVVLMAPSGGGKTTVVRTIAGLEPFDAGEVHVNGTRLGPGRLPRESRLRLFRRSVGVVFQFHHLFANLTAIENVMLAPVHAHGVSREGAECRARELLSSLGVLARAHAFPATLSGGEAQRVAIARALAVDPPLLLLDEPTASLDPARRGDLGKSLRALSAAGRTLLVTTHDHAFARAFASRVAILSGGRIVEQGEPSQVLDRPSHPATKLLLSTKSPGSGAG